MAISRRRGRSLTTGRDCSCGSGRQSQRHLDHRKPRPSHSSSQKESSIDIDGIRTTSRYGHCAPTVPLVGPNLKNRKWIRIQGTWFVDST